MRGIRRTLDSENYQKKCLDLKIKEIVKSVPRIQYTQGSGTHCDIDKKPIHTEHSLGDSLAGMDRN